MWSHTVAGLHCLPMFLPACASAQLRVCTTADGSVAAWFCAYSALLTCMCLADNRYDCCVSNGGLYIKLGQSISIMNHVLPEPFVRRFVDLQVVDSPSTFTCDGMLHGNL